MKVETFFFFFLFLRDLVISLINWQNKLRIYKSRLTCRVRLKPHFVLLRRNSKFCKSVCHPITFPFYMRNTPRPKPRRTARVSAIKLPNLPALSSVLFRELVISKHRPPKELFEYPERAQIPLLGAHRRPMQLLSP